METTLSSHSSSVENKLPDPITYYRSQLFTLNDGVNPLTAAAAPIFALLSRLAFTTTYDDLPTLHAHLVHEIHAFTQQAKNANYAPETILIARYALCATLDEVIQKTPWGMTDAWIPHQLLTAFHRESSAAERFFNILSRLCENAALHIDVIELYYLCIQAGFQGKYAEPETRSAFDEWLAHLIQVIRQVRRSAQRELHVHLSAQTPTTTRPQLTIPIPPRKQHCRFPLVSRKVAVVSVMATVLIAQLTFVGLLYRAFIPLQSTLNLLITPTVETTNR